MSKSNQEFFKDGTVYDTSRLINKQLSTVKKGNDYFLPEVYFSDILEFRMDGIKSARPVDEWESHYFYDVALCDKYTHEVLYDKLGYKMVSLPSFKKKPNELNSVMDQWFYLNGTPLANCLPILGPIGI
ncbi:Rpn family recombination-promoting nuclease/putative transposase [Sphingobacterium sp. KU25419]|nr:Rpn family recombination-promoting nuclease/putative transposase [Sphingobacterium sp. KU25419]